MVARFYRRFFYKIPWNQTKWDGSGWTPAGYACMECYLLNLVVRQRLEGMR